MSAVLTSKASLDLHDITVSRAGRILVKDLSISLNEAQILWVEGENGIGKTSLLRVCAGLSRPLSGQLIWRAGAQACTAPEIISFLPAQSYAKAGLTTHEDARFWGVEDSLDKVGLSAHLQTRTNRLSTGQRKRLSLAKLIAQNKPIWILDEPLAGLDPQGRDFVAQILRQHIKAGGIAVIASHAPIAVNDVHVQRLSLRSAT